MLVVDDRLRSSGASPVPDDGSLSIGTQSLTECNRE